MKVTECRTSYVWSTSIFPGMQRDPSHYNRGTSSMFIHKHKKSSMFIHKHKKSSMFIHNHQKSPMFIHNHQKSSMFIHNHQKSKHTNLKLSE